jgi:hypothetical protein
VPRIGDEHLARRSGRPGGRSTFDTDAHTRGCTSPPNVVCALWPTVLLSDDTRCLSEHVQRGRQANTVRRRNVAITKDIRGDTRCRPRS